MYTSSDLESPRDINSFTPLTFFLCTLAAVARQAFKTLPC